MKQDKRLIRFALWIFLAALCFAPISYTIAAFSIQHINQIVAITTGKPKIVVLGNSINTAFSPCDKDSSTIPEIIGKKTGMTTMDATQPGAKISEILACNDLALRYTTPKYIVLPVLDMPFNKSFPSGRLQRNLRNNAISLMSLNIPPLTESTETTIISKKQESALVRWLEAAGNLKPPTVPCSEVDYLQIPEIVRGHEYIYGQHNTPFDGSYIINSVKKIKAQGITPILYIPPIYYEGIENFTDPKTKINLDIFLESVRDKLNLNKIKYIDLSKAVNDELFIHRVRATGHMNYEGKHIVGHMIAEEILKIEAEHN